MRALGSMEAKDPANQLIFGFPEEWAAFQKRHPTFLERFTHITEATRVAFSRVMDESSAIERFVMLYGRLCVEDFHEIMLCCGNGYGFAALKLLRGLYEKAVTLEYLNDNPEELEPFYEYRGVSDFKMMQSITDVFGPNVLTPEFQAQVRTEYERVKDRYMVTACRKCETTRVNFSWTKLDLAAMAKKTRILGKLIQSSYYIPMRHAHSTGASLIERLEHNEEGFGFDPDAQRSQADDALNQAHSIILEVLYVQQKRFTIDGFDPLYDRCVEDWKEIRGVEDDGSRTKPNP